MVGTIRTIGKGVRKLGDLVSGHKYHLNLTPGGDWQTNPWQTITAGTLASGKNSGRINIPDLPNGLMDRLTGINLNIWTTYGGPPMGYLRVTGIRKGGGYKTMWTNTGFGGFGFPMGGVDSDGDGVADQFGYSASSQFIPGIQRLYEIASSVVLRSLLPSALGDLAQKYLPELFVASLLNSRVFTGFRYTPALRVENIYSVAPVNYNVTVRTSTWTPYKIGNKRPWWHRLWYGNAGTK